jgi:hypothetical protein
LSLIARARFQHLAELTDLWPTIVATVFDLERAEEAL